VRKLPLLLVIASLAGLAIASPATAASERAQIASSRVVATPAVAQTSSGGLIAPTSACPGQDRLDAPAQAQVSTMRCMTDFARRQVGLSGLAYSAALEQSAAEKSADILRCDSFSHSACGREFSYWMREAGYTSAPCWRLGENLAFGTDAYGSVRAIFEAWMRSPSHRTNILGDFTELGVSVRAGTLSGRPETRIWTQHFGSRCPEPAA